jgi:hypothetical protein
VASGTPAAGDDPATFIANEEGHGDRHARGEPRRGVRQGFEMTGARALDASAMVEHFQPLKVWLDRRNADVAVGL